MSTALNFLIASKRCEIAGLRQLAETSGLVKAIGHFVHALQRERGLSNLYLGSSGLQGDTERLTQIEQSQIWQTQVLVCFDALERDAAVPNGQGLRLLARIAYVLQGLEALPGLRERVRTQAWRAAQATAAYTQLIQALLSVVFEAADPALDPAISRQLVALFNLMQGKEFAGQERAIGSALFASGQFTEIDIKSRAVRHDVFVIGTDPAHRAFVYARLALLSGRSPEIKRDLAQRLQAVLEKFFPHSGGLNLQLSVELQDMDRDSFLKTFIKN